MSRVNVEDAEVEYFVDGEGPGLVLVHGTGGNADTNWGHLIERFSKHWKVVRPNYSGSGNTTDSGVPLSIEILAAQVVATAKAAGAAPFDLVGFSLGASVALAVAAKYPELVRSIVLLAGFADSNDSYLRLEFQLWRDLIHGNRSALAQLVLLTGFSSDFLATLRSEDIEGSVASIVNGNNWDGMARQVDLDLSLDIRELVPTIKTPTLVIGCTHDCMVPVRHSRWLADQIPGAEYSELASGHLAPLERPDEFASRIETFLLRRHRP